MPFPKGMPYLAPHEFLSQIQADSRKAAYLETPSLQERRESVYSDAL